MAWEKLPAYTGKVYQGCLHASPVEETAPLDTMVAVGFGSALITKDGEVVYSEPSNPTSWDDLPELSVCEAMAQADPEHDWRMVLEAPLRGSTYQRQGDERWVLVESTMGFA